MNKLSIIIPVYNEERTIGETLKRVFDIPLDGWEKEIIVVDDGSTDKTRSVLKAWEKKVQRIKKENRKGALPLDFASRGRWI